MSTKEALRAARKALRLSQPELAERAGVNTSTVWRWENEGIPDRGTARKFIDQIIREANATPARATAA